MTKAEDLRNGDVITFRDMEYLCLSNATDRRTTMSVITCLAFPPDADADSRRVVVLRLVRCFPIQIVDHIKSTSIEVIDNTEEEFSEAVKNGSFEQVGR
jgi:hypothetical protein